MYPLRFTAVILLAALLACGQSPESDLRAAIDHARDVAVASGIPRADYYAKAVLGN
jgi:hypothetical protein